MAEAMECVEVDEQAKASEPKEGLAAVNPRFIVKKWCADAPAPPWKCLAPALSLRRTCRCRMPGRVLQPPLTQNPARAASQERRHILVVGHLHR